MSTLLQFFEGVRPVLEKLPMTIRSAAPQAEDVISYQIPAFRYHRPSVFFAAFRNLYRLYVVSKLIVEAFSSELKPRGHIRQQPSVFPAKHPLPAPLVKKIFKARIEENEVSVKNTKT